MNQFVIVDLKLLKIDFFVQVKNYRWEGLTWIQSLNLCYWKSWTSKDIIFKLFSNAESQTYPWPTRAFTFFFFFNNVLGKPVHLATDVSPSATLSFDQERFLQSYCLYWKRRSPDTVNIKGSHFHCGKRGLDCFGRIIWQYFRVQGDACADTANSWLSWDGLGSWCVSIIHTV